MCHGTKYSPAKTGEYPRIFSNFENCVRCEKDLKDNKDNSLHLGRKYARIFVLRHYLFLVAHSFPWATLSENCLLLGTDNVRGQISVHIFTPNGGYCLNIPQFSKLCMLRKRFVNFEKENRPKPFNIISIVHFLQTRLFTGKFSWRTTVHTSIFLGQALWADSTFLQMNTITSCDKSQPIRVGEN